MSDQSKDQTPTPEPPNEANMAEQLTQELAKVRSEQEDLMARLQRVSADYMNYQKRVQRDIAEAREYANSGLIKDLLVVLDDLERGLSLARTERAEDDPLRKGVQLVYDKLLATLGRYDLEAIPAQGQPFDPQLHSALMQEVSEDVEPMTVLRELQRGYRLKGRTLRPASVVVSKAMDEPAD